MLFTKATEKDADSVLSLYHSLVGTEGCVWNMDYPSEIEVDFDLSREALYCLKDDENELIGVISIDDDPAVKELACWSPELLPSVELSRLGVRCDKQNQGIARFLLTRLMEELKSQGMRSVRLLVCKDNEKAIRSYSKLNFHVAGETELFGHEYWCYEKDLLDEEQQTAKSRVMMEAYGGQASFTDFSVLDTITREFIRENPMRYKVTRIEEMDYGCEGLQEGEEIKVSMFVQDEDGNVTIKRVNDSLLYTRNINEGDIIILRDGEPWKL